LNDEKGLSLNRRRFLHWGCDSFRQPFSFRQWPFRLPGHPRRNGAGANGGAECGWLLWPLSRQVAGIGECPQPLLHQSNGWRRTAWPSTSQAFIASNRVRFQRRHLHSENHFLWSWNRLRAFRFFHQRRYALREIHPHRKERDQLASELRTGWSPLWVQRPPLSRAQLLSSGRIRGFSGHYQRRRPTRRASGLSLESASRRRIGARGVKKGRFLPKRGRERNSNDRFVHSNR